MTCILVTMTNLARTRLVENALAGEPFHVRYVPRDQLSVSMTEATRHAATIVVTDDPRALEALRQDSSLQTPPSPWTAICFQPPEHDAAPAGRRADEPSDEAGNSLILPTDASDREVRLAVQLLAENLALRERLEREQASRKQLALVASTDPLTGLPNRRAWDEQLQQCWFSEQVRVGDRAAENIPPRAHAALVLLDVDKLKQVNDSLGHAQGDHLLRAVGAALRETLRHDDFAARLGGDEFGLLLWNLPEPRAAAVVQRIQKAIEAAASRIRGRPVIISAGWTLTSHHATADDAFEAADARLRTAKRARREA